MGVRAAEEQTQADGSDKALQRAMSVVEGAIEASPQDSKWLASAYRFKSELLEKMSRSADAIEAYRPALALNPKVGVKKRLVELEKVTLPQAR